MEMDPRVPPVACLWEEVLIAKGRSLETLKLLGLGAEVDMMKQTYYPKVSGRSSRASVTLWFDIVHSVHFKIF